MANLACVVLAAACARGPTDDDRRDDPRHEAPDAPLPSGCGALTDRPPGDIQEWTYVGPPDADVAWGIQPSVIWDGSAAWISAGPQGDCQPCEFRQTHTAQVARAASDLALELEMGCGADLLTDEMTRAVAGVRLHITGPRQGLPDGTDGYLDLHDLPLELTSLDALGDACVASTDPAGIATSDLREGAFKLEPGRFLTWRADLEPVIRAAGMDPQTTVINAVGVDLVVHSKRGATAWIELGRTFLEACP